MHKMKTELRKTQAQDPDFVRCEGVNIIDLQGLSRAALSSETMAVIKLASKISDYFPEVRPCAVGVCSLVGVFTKLIILDADSQLHADYQCSWVLWNGLGADQEVY